MTIWIALPAYNEGPRIGTLLARWAKVLSKLDCPHRYVIVDDGSADDTPRILADFAEHHPVHIITHSPNQGLGQALRNLFHHVAERAEMDDLIATMDADNTHPPELLPDMLHALERNECKVVIASRFRPGAVVHGLGPFRRLTASGATWLFRLLVPVSGVRDYTCGYRLIRVSALHAAMKRDGRRFCGRDGFECTADVLLSLADSGATFHEVPLTLEYAEKAGNSQMNVSRTIRDTLSVIAERRRNR